MVALNTDNIHGINVAPLAKYIKDWEAMGYFGMAPGKEHYKLLAYLSWSFDNITISDIGTYKGCSALALSYNENNKVISYDVQDLKALNGHPENIEFKIIEPFTFSRDILKSYIIFLDVLHDGVLESQIIDFLTDEKWHGILIMDDIHHFPNLELLYNSISIQEKTDATELGHWSGTGIIYFRP